MFNTPVLSRSVGPQEAASISGLGLEIADHDIEVVNVDTPRDRSARSMSMHACNGDKRSADYILTFDKYSYWARALARGDVRTVQRALTSCNSTEEQHKLTGGRFVYHDVAEARQTFGDDVLPNAMEDYIKSEMKTTGGKYVRGFYPLHIAAVTGHKNILTELVNGGADPTVVGVFGWNIIHCLAALGSRKARESVEIYRHLCAHVLSQENGLTTLRQLLMHEDAGGFRPFELSVKMSAFDLSRAIMNTENVYRFTKTANGFHDIAWFDVTDYNIGGDRMYKTPFELFRFTRYSQIGRVDEESFLNSPMMKWANSFMKHYLLIAVGWFVYRTVYVTLFIIFMQDFLIRKMYEMRVNVDFAEKRATYNSSMNVTLASHKINCHDKSYKTVSTDDTVFILRALLYTRLIGTIISMISDSVQFIKHRKFQKTMFVYETHGDYVVSSTFYLVCDDAHIISAIIGLEVSMYGDLATSSDWRTFLYFCIAIASICNVWSLLFFLKVLPKVGHFVIIFQEMMMSLLNFSVIYVLILISFSVAFYALLGSQCMRGDFDSFGQTIYTTFILMLNMVNLINNGIDIEQPEGIIVVCLHITYVLVVAILLLNFLIAVMSGTVLKVAEKKSLVTTFQKLATVVTIERRLGFLLNHIHPRNKDFIYQNGRVYFPCMVDYDSDGYDDDDRDERCIDKF